MNTAPRRIQLSRAKGWRMPANTVKVSRPGIYGNPFVIGAPAPAAYGRFHSGVVEDAAQAVNLYRRALTFELSRPTPAGERAIDLVADLRGKNLACWCALDQPCHADVLLEIANVGEIEHPATPLIDEARSARRSTQQEGS